MGRAVCMPLPLPSAPPLGQSGGLVTVASVYKTTAGCKEAVHPARLGCVSLLSSTNLAPRARPPCCADHQPRRGRGWPGAGGVPHPRLPVCAVWQPRLLHPRLVCGQRAGGGAVAGPRRRARLPQGATGPPLWTKQGVGHTPGVSAPCCHAAFPGCATLRACPCAGATPCPSIPALPRLPPSPQFSPRKMLVASACSALGFWIPNIPVLQQLQAQATQQQNVSPPMQPLQQAPPQQQYQQPPMQPPYQQQPQQQPPMQQYQYQQQQPQQPPYGQPGQGPGPQQMPWQPPPQQHHGAAPPPGYRQGPAGPPQPPQQRGWGR